MKFKNTLSQMLLNNYIIKISILLSTILCCSGIYAQKTIDSVASYTRNYTHNRRIDAIQLEADKLDRNKNRYVQLSDKEKTNDNASEALLKKVDEFQLNIEKSKIYNNNQQVGILTEYAQLLGAYIYDLRKNKSLITDAEDIIETFEKILIKREDKKSVQKDFDKLSDYSFGILLSFAEKTDDYDALKKTLFLRKANSKPETIMDMIDKYADEPFAKDLILKAAPITPSKVYSALRNNKSKINPIIRSIDDPLINGLKKIADIPIKNLMYFPFLDDIIKERKPIEYYTKFIGVGENDYDSLSYFNELCIAETEASTRLSRKENVFGYYGSNGLEQTINKKALEHFVNRINELHESGDAVRYKSIQKLNPMQLYYMIVLGENDIYTSSYKYSYNFLMKKLNGTAKGDSLLLLVKFNKYKKFIKMAANFGQLDNFLNYMTPSNATLLMTQFCKLNENKEKALEEAADVADSYSSIKNIELKKTLLENISENEAKSGGRNDKDLQIIYNLLKTICESSDNPEKIDLSTTLGIPPIYTIDNKTLADANGRIVEQLFFYGDDDGRGVFEYFVRGFSSSEWKFNHTKDWVEFRNKKNPNFYVFANRAMHSDDNSDDTAQLRLTRFLLKNDFAPAIIIHRGHSYWLPRTIDKMPNSGKIIFLGSCGGYKSLSTIVDLSDNAHIISTKEIGKGKINAVVIKNLHNSIINNKTIKWPEFWASLRTQIPDKPGFDEYIPPHKNLGAIFMKAYNVAKINMN